MPVKVCGLNCSLKTSDHPSNTSVMMNDVVAWMRDHDEIDYSEIRIADFNVKPGMEWDEGGGDDWPQIGERVLAAEVLLFGTPIWIGHPSTPSDIESAAHPEEALARAKKLHES